MKLFPTRKSKANSPAKWGLGAPPGPRRSRSYLVAIAVGTVILWQLPFGQTLLYPFSLLATWFHELGHGLASAALGASFEELVIYADGSGYALSAWPADAPRLFHALTAAAGLFGPALAGAALIVSSRSQKATRIALYVLGALLIGSTALWVRSPVGWVVLPAIGALVLGIASRGSENLRRLAVEFLGVQAAISIWRDINYLFSAGAVVGGEVHQSDTAAIAEVLILPYWFWGAAITAAIAWMLWKALAVASER